MLILTTSAKTLDFVSDWSCEKTSVPFFIKEAGMLAQKLAGMSEEELAAVMNVSEELARLNRDRYLEWVLEHNKENSKPAILAYKGDIFRQMCPERYNKVQQSYAQNCLLIVSGLYGLLRAYDLIQPYRLEMTTKIKGKGFGDLYEYWSEALCEYANVLASKYKHEYLIDVSSKAYGKALRLAELEIPVIEMVFLYKKSGEYKPIPILAKKARGMMIEYMIKNRVSKLGQLEKFSTSGFKLLERSSREMVFGTVFRPVKG